MSGTQRSSEGLIRASEKSCSAAGIAACARSFAARPVRRRPHRSTQRNRTDQLENFMEAQDADIFSWFAGSKPVDPQYDAPIFETIRAFHTHHSPVNL